MFVFFPDSERIPPKPRKSLQFETPKNKQTKKVVDTLGSPMFPLTDALMKNDGQKMLTGSGQKRGRDETDYQSDSDLEYDEEDLNVKGIEQIVFNHCVNSPYSILTDFCQYLD